MVANPLQVIVIGGGIGGLCLAQGLRRAGIQVALYERDRSPRDRLEGYRIHIDPDGAKALHRCLPPALWEAFVASTVDLGSFRFLGEDLEELMVLEGDAAGAAATGPTERSHAIDRVTLRELLLRGLDDVVHFDRRFDRYEPRPGGRVVAHFTDGSRAEGDVLVGSDGVNSRVRQQLLPHARHADTDVFGVGFKLPLDPQVRGWLTPPLSSGRNMIMAAVPYFLSISVFDPMFRTLPTSRSREEGYVGSAFVGRREVFPAGAHELDGAALRDVVSARIAGWHPQLRRLIAESDPASALLVSYRTSIEPDPWPASRVTLIGDAIHAMPPVGGLGGNTALRDADLLHRKLALAAGGEIELLGAMADYESTMREYGFEAVRKAQYYQQQGLRTDQTVLRGMKAASAGGSRPPALQTRDVTPRKGYDLWAEVYDDSPNPVVAMDQRHTLRILAPRPGERILDAGCVTGRYLGALREAGSHPSGLDSSTGMLAVARRRHPDLPLLEGDLQSTYPFPDGAFDAVLCALVAEHLSEPLAALREMRRVLRPEGRLVFSVFHPKMAAAGMQAQFMKDGVWYRLGAHGHTIEDYERWMAEAGLTPTRRHEYVGDEALVTALPFFRMLLGFPVLLVIEATPTHSLGG
jgi:2-polyprenyl-6-methoxyphenol hydroxylase-like FAD-dependent oxidoreductase/ubiquinone/menaquinone biosynthesis C-methylase UbiE